MQQSAPAELKAILWDVDGTLAETERDGHRVAFNRAFESLELPWRWSEARYGELLAVAGGLERLLHDMQTQAAAPADHSAQVQLAQRLHQLKNQHYLGFLRTGAVPLRPGVRELLDDCRRAGVHLGIVTTTGGANVAELLRGNLGEQWRRGFSVVIAAEEAPRKKPDPQAYDLALEQLGLRPAQAVAIEDSPAGASAAHSAGIAVLLTRSSYFATANVAGVMAVGPSLAHSEGWHPAPAAPGRIDLPQIRQWHAHFVADARRAPAAPPAPVP